MPPFPDVPDGLQEFVDVWSAATAGDLHRVLVLHQPVRGSADAFEPFALLTKHHGIEPEQSLTTAVLLLTDRRWRDGAGRLVRRIAESEILAVAQLDGIAMVFLAAEDAVFWPVPEHWFSGDEIVLDLEDMQVVDDPGAEVPGAPVMARREVWPPLRRWAAGHLLARDPGSWFELLSRARQLDAGSAAAVVTGLMDRIDILSPDAQAALVDQGVGWPQHEVRRLALEFLAHRDGPDVAYRLACRDPNARVRNWAETLLTGAVSGADRDRGSATSIPSRDDGDAGQAALF